MASYTLSPIGGAGFQFFDNNGNILSGGKLYTYVAGTTTPQETWTTPAGTTQNSNPIILNSAGRPPQEIWLSVAYSYKFVIKDANDTLIATYDNIPGLPQPAIVNDASSISYEPNTLISAGSFVVGQTYMIASLGSTDFTTIGAAYNSAGVIFTATGVGSGTGTAYVSTTVETRLRAYESDNGSDYIGFLPTGTDAITTRTVQDKLRETVSVKDFGAVGDGVTDDTTAIQNALDSIETSGGTIYFPLGTYIIATSLNLQSFAGIKLLGTGATTTPASYGSILKFTAASGSRLIDARSSQGLAIESLAIQQTNFSYSGIVLDLSQGSSGFDSAYTIAYNCSFSATSLTTIIDVSKAIILNFDCCVFYGGLYAIANNGSYANAITISGCTFNQSYGVPIYSSTGFPTTWNVTNNTFEQAQDNSAKAFKIASACVFDTLTYVGNWHGDANATGIWLDFQGSLTASTISGNHFGVGLTSIKFANTGIASSGVNVTGNSFSSVTNGIDYSAASSGVYGDCFSNFFYLVTNNVVGAPIIGRLQTNPGLRNTFKGTVEFSNSSVNGVGSTVSGVAWTIDSGSTAQVAQRIQFPSTAGQYATQWGVSGGVNVAFVQDNGSFYSATGTYGTISDASLKENIVDATPKLDDLMKVQIKNYNLISHPELKQLGVIAQQLESVFPGMVEIDKDGVKSVKQSVFIPILIKAIQELKAEIDAYKAVQR